MEHQLFIDFPESLSSLLNMNNQESAREIKVLPVVKMYELEKLSSGQAARLLGISRIEFLELLSKYQVSYFSFRSEKEIENDRLNA